MSLFLQILMLSFSIAVKNYNNIVNTKIQQVN